MHITPIHVYYIALIFLSLAVGPSCIQFPLIQYRYNDRCMRYHACVYVNGSSRVKYEVTENPFKIPKYVRVQALDGCRTYYCTDVHFIRSSQLSKTRKGKKRQKSFFLSFLTMEFCRLQVLGQSNYCDFIIFYMMFFSGFQYKHVPANIL